MKQKWIEGTGLIPVQKFHIRRYVDGGWQAGFTIGVQTFYLQPVDKKEEAQWYKKCLKEALKNLTDNGKKCL